MTDSAAFQRNVVKPPTKTSTHTRTHTQVVPQSLRKNPFPFIRPRLHASISSALYIVFPFATELHTLQLQSVYCCSSPADPETIHYLHEIQCHLSDIGRGGISKACIFSRDSELGATPWAEKNSINHLLESRNSRIRTVDGRAVGTVTHRGVSTPGGARARVTAMKILHAIDGR